MPGLRSILDSAWLGSYPRLTLPARGRRALESKNDARPGTCAVFCGSRGFPALQAKCMGPSLRLAQGRMKTIWVMSSKIRPFASLRVTRLIDRSRSESSQFRCTPLTDSRTLSRHNLNLSFRMTKLKGDWLRAEG